MAARVGTVAELANALPLKHVINQQPVLLFLRNGDLAAATVPGEYFGYDAFTLAQNYAMLPSVTAFVHDDAVWVVLPDDISTKVKKANTGFGLGSGFGLQQIQDAENHRLAAPCVPEPWMGTYGEKLAVLPVDNAHTTHAPVEAQGREWRRLQSEARGVAQPVAPKSPVMRQATLSSMFARAPLKVEDMDF